MIITVIILLVLCSVLLAGYLDSREKIKYYEKKNRDRELEFKESERKDKEFQEKDRLDRLVHKVDSLARDYETLFSNIKETDRIMRNRTSTLHDSVLAMKEAVKKGKK